MDGVGFRVWGVGCRVWGVVCRVYGLGLRVQTSRTFAAGDSVFGDQVVGSRGRELDFLSFFVEWSNLASLGSSRSLLLPHRPRHRCLRGRISKNEFQQSNVASHNVGDWNWSLNITDGGLVFEAHRLLYYSTEGSGTF